MSIRIFPWGVKTRFYILYYEARCYLFVLIAFLLCNFVTFYAFKIIFKEMDRDCFKL